MKSPSFIDDTRFYSMDAAASDVEQLQAMLANLTRIHTLTINKFDNFDDLIHQYVVAGVEVFRLETGIVSEINGDLHCARCH